MSTAPAPSSAFPGPSPSADASAVSVSKTWTGDGMTQDDFMKKDECILCNEKDEVMGSASKYDAHIFSPETVSLPLSLLYSLSLTVSHSLVENYTAPSLSFFSTQKGSFSFNKEHSLK
jgi:hypothetical protein